MKKTSQPHWILRELAERRAPRATINLWTRIVARLEDRSRERKSGMVSRTSRNPIAWTIAAVILLVAVVVAVPQARASVSSFFQRMGMEFTQPKQGPGDAAVENIEPIRVTPRPSKTLEEIQNQLPFTLMIPAWLPENLSLFHADVDQPTSEGKHVGLPCADLEYRPAGAPLDDPRHISFKVSLGEECGGPFLLPVTKEQSVEVNGQPGSFVEGGWRSDGKGDPETTYGNLQWDDSYGDTYLAWSQDGLNYFIAAFELGLTREEMLQIAESIQEP